jgi:hypothetical protein
VNPALKGNRRDVDLTICLLGYTGASLGQDGHNKEPEFRYSVKCPCRLTRNPTRNPTTAASYSMQRCRNQVTSEKDPLGHPMFHETFQAYAF